MRVSRKDKGKEPDTVPRGRRAGRHAGPPEPSAERGSCGGRGGTPLRAGEVGTRRESRRARGLRGACAPSGVRTSERRARTSRSAGPGKEGLSGGREGGKADPNTPGAQRGQPRARPEPRRASSAPPRAPGGGGDRWRPGARAAGTSGSCPSSHPAPRRAPLQPAPFPCPAPQASRIPELLLPSSLAGLGCCLHTLKSTQT